MSSWLHAVLTDSNGEHDLGYLLWSIGVLAFIGLSIWEHAKFDAQAFGIGFGAVLGAGGAMTWMRSKGGVTQ